MEPTCSRGWRLWAGASMEQSRAMGSQKALLKLVETKGIRSQCFPHPKIELSEYPELFGSALEL